MALHLAGLSALVKSFVPSFSRVRPLDGPTVEPEAIDVAVGEPSQSDHAMSAATEAALAALELPPDGPIDTHAALRAKLPPELAAAKFVQWVRALELTGCYPRRSIIGLYREFSEVDHRQPIGNIQFLQALDRTAGVRKERLCIVSGRTRFGVELQWIIERAGELQLALPAVPEATADAPAAKLPAVEPVAVAPPVEAVVATSEVLPPASPRIERKPPRHTPMLLRYPVDEHPFSPSGLREHAKHARRARLNATASRKQRGALRRAH